ncbi:MAG: metal ABC transporter permease [Muribaculaceae bacterium]|nr:metal ABC transporter permease [Muribaculaceae bacterium]
MSEITTYLQYDFFRYAIAGVILISICAAAIGTYIISRRLVAISGGVTHACFGGLGLGYFLGVSPVAMAAAVAVVSSLGVEWASSRFRIREDSAIAVIWALGMAVGVLFVFLTPGYVPELNSFLFGNILTINSSDLLVFALYTAVLGLFFLRRYKMIVACAFDRDFARVSGLPVRYITYTMTVLVAVCIVLTIRLVGVMLLMSMLSLPMMTAEIWCRRFGPMMLWSMVISLLTSVAGLMAGTLIDVPCSALIVLSMATVFLLARTVAELLTLYKRN